MESKKENRTPSKEAVKVAAAIQSKTLLLEYAELTGRKKGISDILDVLQQECIKVTARIDELDKKFTVLYQQMDDGILR